LEDLFSEIFQKKKKRRKEKKGKKGGKRILPVKVAVKCLIFLSR
jgi:hypothetical protein